MKIAILSGKGGTGKTFVSANLAAAAEKALYVDCDVEEPNGHLFFKPENLVEQNVVVCKPVFDKSKCSGCRKCVDFCAFNALAYILGRPVLFDEVCHSCGGCKIICPENAIEEDEITIGKVRKGVSGNVEYLGGEMIEGNSSGTPIIKDIFKEIAKKDNELVIIDCPPGSACLVMESIEDADYCIIVAEPTIFGSHNFKMVYELLKEFRKPFGVILNKCTDAVNPSEELASKENMKILGKINFDKEMGKLNSEGILVARENGEFKNIFSDILGNILKEARR